MRILLTGGTGYLGSTLAKCFLELGYEVSLTIRQSSDRSRIVDFENELLLFDLDSTSFESSLLAYGPIDCCIHCATRYGRAGESEEDVRETNFSFPKKILELLSNGQLKSFINIDTPIPASVSHYAKYKAEFREFFKNTESVSLRIGIMLQYFYGENEPKGRLVSSLTDAAVNGCSSFDLSPGEQKRDFVHIRDVEQAFRQLLSQINSLPSGYTEYQIGSGKAVSLKELVRIINSKCPKNVTEFRFGALPYRDHEPMEVVATLGAKEQGLGWTPCIDLEDGIEKVIEHKKGKVQCAT